jgi:hypothetical protein
MEVDNIGNSGAFSLEYVHRFNHVIGIGGIISGQQETGDLCAENVTKCGDMTDKLLRIDARNKIQLAEHQVCHTLLQIGGRSALQP